MKEIPTDFIEFEKRYDEAKEKETNRPVHEDEHTSTDVLIRKFAKENDIIQLENGSYLAIPNNIMYEKIKSVQSYLSNFHDVAYICKVLKGNPNEFTCFTPCIDSFGIEINGFSSKLSFVVVNGIWHFVDTSLDEKHTEKMKYLIKFENQLRSYREQVPPENKTEFDTYIRPFIKVLEKLKNRYTHQLEPHPKRRRRLDNLSPENKQFLKENREQKKRALEEEKRRFAEENKVFQLENGVYLTLPNQTRLQKFKYVRTLKDPTNSSERGELIVGLSQENPNHFTYSSFKFNECIRIHYYSKGKYHLSNFHLGEFLSEPEMMHHVPQIENKLLECRKQIHTKTLPEFDTYMSAFLEALAYPNTAI